MHGSGLSWVLFSYGTCVIVREPGPDLVEQATAVLKEWGPVAAGSPYGDFGVHQLKSAGGWLVSCHHPDILTHVGPDEVKAGALDVHIGVLGRDKRRQDVHDPKVVHVENLRGTLG